VPPDAVDVRADADTSATPWTVSSGNYSSRFAAVGASAVHQAASELAGRLRAIAGPMLEVEPDAVELVDGRAQVVGEPGRAVSLRRLVGSAHWDPAGLPAAVAPGLAVTAHFALPLEPPDADDRVNSSGTYGFIADVALVEVDRDTGEVDVRAYATVHDAGRILNPLIAEGQIHGGLAHGLGAALLEEHRWDEDGNLMTATFVDYLPPTATELPPVRSGTVETPSPLTPLGAKGLGEGNTMSAPATIANAVADALGRDDLSLPLTPARVWALLQP
jgi:2-furoyl-CoA dehydrogenase large subunit